jgi:HAD superfamily hydrolase (TIGR01509 family)
VSRDGDPRPFDLVIFDNDGVLIDSETLAFTVLVDLLEVNGISLSTEEAVERFLGGPVSRVLDWAADAGTPLPGDFDVSYHDDLFAAFDRSLTATAGAVDVVDRLAAVTSVCVASSGSRERIRRSLAKVGLLERFDGRMFSTEDVAEGKPAPDLFLHAADRMGVSPERCVVVEDSPLGVEAAGAAGMASVGFSRSVPADRLARATLGVVEDLLELPARLGFA